MDCELGMTYPTDVQITTFDEAVDYMIDLIGSDFKKALTLASHILEDPHSYSGPQATMAAMKLAVHRTRIGVAVQHWKQESARTKKPHDRLIKDSLMVMYDSLLEMINTLKAHSKYEREVIT